MSKLRWVELLPDMPEPGAHAIVRDGLLVRWVNTGRDVANRWSSLAADQLDAIGHGETAPVLLPWQAVVDRGPVQLSLDAAGAGMAVVDLEAEHVEQTGGPVELQAGVVDTDLRWRAAQLAVASSREACRDISGASAVGAELVDLATVWESWLNGTFEDRGDVVFIGDEELERFRAWEANQRTPDAAGGQRDG